MELGGDQLTNDLIILKNWENNGIGEIGLVTPASGLVYLQKWKLKSSKYFEPNFDPYK